MKYKKPTKIVIINGKKHLAIRERNCTPPKEEPTRVTEEYVLPKHTSLFVKILEKTIEHNLEFYFKKIEDNHSMFLKEATEKFLAGDSQNAELLLNKSKDLEKILKASPTKAKLTLMSLLLLNFDKLTSQIVSRLD